MKEALFIFLGWLFGLLSPPIVSRIERRHKCSTFKIVIKNELKNLSFRLAGNYHLIQTHLGINDKASLKEIKSMYEKYGGEYCPEIVLQSIDVLLKLPEDQFKILQEKVKAKENVGLGLKSFSLPFTESILENIDIFNSQFQKDILNLRDHVVMLNEEIELSMRYFYLTFDASVMDRNAKIIRDNLKNSYVKIQERCRLIIDKIEKFLKCN